MDELIKIIEKRRAELMGELAALDRAADALFHVKGVVMTTTHSTTVSKGFLSEEAKRKISEAQKKVWAERKAKMAQAARKVG